jgi:hypothetical protein
VFFDAQKSKQIARENSRLTAYTLISVNGMRQLADANSMTTHEAEAEYGLRQRGAVL